MVQGCEVFGCLGCERPTAGGCACTCMQVSGLIYSLLTTFALVSYSSCWRSAPPSRSTWLRDKMNQADRLNEHDTCFTTTDVHNPTKNGSHRLTPSPAHLLSLIEMPTWEYPSNPTIATVLATAQALSLSRSWAYLTPSRLRVCLRPHEAL